LHGDCGGGVGASSALICRGDLLEGDGCLDVLAGFVDVEAVEVVFVAGDFVEGVYEPVAYRYVGNMFVGRFR